MATAGLDEVSHDTHDDGLEHFQTYDPKLAARTARAQMGLGPYESLPDEQIMNADPHAPEARTGGRGVQYKHLSRVDTYGGSWTARFADTRPVEGVGKPAYAPGALPQASEAGAGAATAGTGARTLFNVGKKMMKASDDGLRQSIDIYQAPDGKKLVHVTKWSINQGTDSLEPRTLTKSEVSQVMNHPAVEGLDEKTQQIEMRKLNDFYRSHFGD